MIVADNHGNCIDVETETKLFSVIKEFKPDLRVHLGDCVNLNAWRDGASAVEKNDSIATDVDAGVAFIKKFRPDVMTMGNHDYRLIKRSREGNADTREYATAMLDRMNTALRSCGTKTFAWGVKEGVWQIAGQRFIHGYSAGLTATLTMGRSFGRCVHGHNHTGDIIWLPTYDGGFAQSVPSLCKNSDMEYQKGQINAFKHVEGFALGLADLKKNKYYCGYVVKVAKDSFVMMEPKPC